MQGNRRAAEATLIFIT